MTKIDGESGRYPLEESAHYNLPMAGSFTPFKCVVNPKEECNLV